MPLALVPVSLWREGNVALDEYRGYRDALTSPYCFVESRGRLYPMKPLAVSLLAAPFYAPPILVGVPTDRVEFWVAWGQLVASGFAGLGLGLCFLTIRRWETPGEASSSLSCSVSARASGQPSGRPWAITQADFCAWRLWRT